MRKKRNKSLAIFLGICTVAVIVASIILGSGDDSTQARGSVLINEIMAANNKSVIDDLGNYSD